MTNFYEETPNSNIFPEIVSQKNLDSNNCRLSNELNEICAELNIDIQTKNHVDFKTLDHRHHSPEAETLSQDPNNYLLSTIPVIDTVAKNIEIFICHICDQSFTTFTMLENHLLKVHESCENVKACYSMKVGLVDLSTYGGKIEFEFWLSRQHWAGRQNSNFIFPPSVLKSTRPTFL